MEINLRQVHHIEFYGLPGSGKSTVSHVVAEQLKKDGYKVIEPTYEMDHTNKKKFRVIKKIYKTIFYSMMHPKKLIEIYVLIKNNGYTKIEILRQIINIIPKICIYKRTKKGCIYIWDEGLIQSAISITILENAKINENVKALFKHTKLNIDNIKSIYIRVKKEVALQRMKNRTFHGSRIEKIKDNDERNDLLNKFQDSCENISELNMFVCEANLEMTEKMINSICYEILTMVK